MVLGDWSSAASSPSSWAGSRSVPIWPADALDVSLPGDLVRAYYDRDDNCWHVLPCRAKTRRTEWIVAAPDFDTCDEDFLDSKFVALRGLRDTAPAHRPPQPLQGARRARPSGRSASLAEASPMVTRSRSSARCCGMWASGVGRSSSMGRTLRWQTTSSWATRSSSSSRTWSCCPLATAVRGGGRCRSSWRSSKSRPRAVRTGERKALAPPSGSRRLGPSRGAHRISVLSGGDRCRASPLREWAPTTTSPSSTWSRWCSPLTASTLASSSRSRPSRFGARSV